MIGWRRARSRNPQSLDTRLGLDHLKPHQVLDRGLVVFAGRSRTFLQARGWTLARRRVPHYPYANGDVWNFQKPGHILGRGRVFS